MGVREGEGEGGEVAFPFKGALEIYVTTPVASEGDCTPFSTGCGLLLVLSHAECA